MFQRCSRPIRFDEVEFGGGVIPTSGGLFQRDHFMPREHFRIKEFEMPVFD
jgi:hypothetical protein